jgi:hypothetical protein
LSWVLKMLLAALAVTVVAVVVDGFMTGEAASGIVYAVIATAVTGQWAVVRRESDEARSVADRLFISVFTLLAWMARPALHSLGL